MGNLSHKLLDLNFFSALGTTEREGLSGRQIVGRGEPYTYDKNNGTLVIYDEAGWPWIKMMADVDDVDVLREVLRVYPVKVGAYVPHSNDGGNFVRVVVPALTGNPPVIGTRKEQVDEVVRQMNIRTFGDDRPVRV